MDTKTAIQTTKIRIKNLSRAQAILKQLRKSKLPDAERAKLSIEIDSKDPISHLRAAGWAYCQRIEIAACLNFYHELRGSEFRHGIRKGTEYLYRKEMQELRKELTLTA
jgi:hypothetical protein